MRRRNIGKSAKASTENSISAKTARSSWRREASTTAAEIAALIESTEVSLFNQVGRTYQRQKRRKKHAPLASDQRRSVRVIRERSVYEEECRREGRDRVGGRGRRESPEDGSKGYECEEDEQGRLDRACTLGAKPTSDQLLNQWQHKLSATYDDRMERSLPHLP
jgi:hypothetical protein